MTFKNLLVICTVIAASALPFAAPRTASDVVGVALPQQQQPPPVQLIIGGGGGKQTKLGLPDFTVTAGDAELASNAKTIAGVLWDDLDFEREYYVIPRTSSAAIPVAAYNALPMDRWKELGADYVLAGEVTRSGQSLSLDFRLVAVGGSQAGYVSWSKRYPNCTMQNPRYCAHAIADDFHKDTKNLTGVARTKLAFVSDRDAGSMTGRPMLNPGAAKEIYISDYDGANQLRFTTDRSLALSPNWAPGGAQLAYTSYKSGFPDIYIANLAQPGRGLRRPAGGTDLIHNQVAVFSPDGTRLAVVEARNGNSDIWIMNADGSGAHNITNNSSSDFAPTFNPDGTQLAFISDRSGVPLLYTMNVNGGEPTRLSDIKSDRPTWSPLGFIAFTLEQSSGHDIAVYNFNTTVGSKVTVLTDGRGDNEFPAVAPNGRHIVFWTTRWGKAQLAVIDATGQNLKRLTEAGNNTFPAWQPLAR